MIAPDFRLTDLTGQPFKLLAELDKGKASVTVLEFWSRSCATCREEMRKLSRLRDVITKSEVKGDVIGVAIEEDSVRTEAIQALAEGAEVQFGVLLRDTPNGVTKAYGFSGVSRVFVLNRKGKVCAVFDGTQTIEIYESAVRECK